MWGVWGEDGYSVKGLEGIRRVELLVGGAVGRNRSGNWWEVLVVTAEQMCKLQGKHLLLELNRDNMF